MWIFIFNRFQNQDQILHVRHKSIFLFYNYNTFTWNNRDREKERKIKANVWQQYRLTIISDKMKEKIIISSFCLLFISGHRGTVPSEQILEHIVNAINNRIWMQVLVLVFVWAKHYLGGKKGMPFISHWHIFFTIFQLFVMSWCLVYWFSVWWHLEIAQQRPWALIVIPSLGFTLFSEQNDHYNGHKKKYKETEKKKTKMETVETTVVDTKCYIRVCERT